MISRFRFDMLQIQSLLMCLFTYLHFNKTYPLQAIYPTSLLHIGIGCNMVFHGWPFIFRIGFQCTVLFFFCENNVQFFGKLWS